MTPPYHDPGTPDLRSPLHFMGWVGRGQWRTLAGGIVFGVIWMVTFAPGWRLMPFGNIVSLTLPGPRPVSVSAE